MNSLLKVLITTIVLALMCMLSSYPSEASWTAVDPVPHPGCLSDIFVLSDDSLWGVGPSGEILHRNNGKWELHPAPVVSFDSVFCFNENCVIAAGRALNSGSDKGVIMQWDGIRWDTILEVSMSWQNKGFTGIWGISEDEFFVCGGNGAVYKYSYGSWQQLETGTSAFFQGIWGSEMDDVYVVGQAGDNYTDPGIIMHWNGTNFSVVYNHEFAFHDVWGSGCDYLMAVGDYSVVQWDGINWEEVSELPEVFKINDVWGTSKDDLYLVGNGGHVVHKSSDTWIEMESGISTPLLSIHGTMSGDVFAVSSDSSSRLFLLELDDDGWNTISTRTSGSIEDITGTGPGQAFAVGWTGPYLDAVCAIKQWDGTSWTDTVFENEGYLKAVYAAGPDSAFAVGIEGQYAHTGIIIKWDGTGWSTVSSGIYNGFRDVWGFSPNEYYAVGDGGLILKWDGTGWISVPIPTTADLTGIWGTSSNDLFVTAKSDDYPDPASVLHWDGTAWTTIFEDNGGLINDLIGFSSDDVFALIQPSYGIRQLQHWDGTVWRIVAEFGKSNASWSVSGKLFGFDAEDIYIILDDGSTAYDDLVCHYDGTVIEIMGSPLLYGYNSIWGADRNSILFAGSNQFEKSHFIVEYTPDNAGYGTGVRLSMPTTTLQPGDPFAVTGFLDNPDSTRSNVPVFFILDIHGNLFFWPSWTQYDPPGSDMIDFRKIDVPVGTTKVTVFPAFSWPDLGNQSMSDLCIYGAMLNESMDSIWGDIGMIKFNFGP